MSSSPNSSSRLPGYEILEELGAGGMGVVFKARQVALKRTVAIKMIRSGIKPGRHELARFRFEAEAVARLQHPHIVQVFAVGEAEGEPYIVMEYLDGGSLAKKIAGQAQPWREAAELIEILAKAVHYAHSRGIIHRDLKPANVLLTAEGTPKIADFGLAKSMEGDGVTDGQGILGSPSYMAPEQAWGGSRIKDLGPSVDVYALGAVLYELLTGKPPFKGSSSRETLEQVWRDRPVAPTLLTPAIPRDLEVICLKCLEKEPGKRYVDAHELAEDLRRFRKGIPIKARSVGRAERAWSWCKRNPLPASLVAALIVAIIAGFTGITLKYFEAEAARRDASHEAKRARDAEEQAKRSASQALLAEEQARAAEKEAVEQRQLTAASLEHDLKNKDIDAALAKLAMINRQDHGFEYHWLLRRARGEIAKWPLPYKEAWDLAVSPSGRLGAVASLQSRSVDIIDLETGETKRSLPGHADKSLCVAWSADGKVIATGGADGFARLWDAESGQLLCEMASEHGPVDDVALSENGHRLACAHGDTTAAIWSIEDRAAPKRLSLFTGHIKRYPHREDWIRSGLWTHTRIAITADGALVATAADHSGSTPGERSFVGGPTTDVIFWNAEDGAEKRAILGVRVEHLNDLAFSADGQTLAAGGEDGAIYAWSVADGQPLPKRTGHSGPVRRVAFLGQENKLVSVSWDRSFRVWDLTGARTAAILHRPAHDARLSSVAVRPDGKSIITGAYQELKVWRTEDDPGYVSLTRMDSVETLLCHPSDASQIITGSRSGMFRLWDVMNRKPVFSLRLEGPIQAMRFSPDHKRVAVAGGPHVFVIDLDERKVISTYKEQAARVHITNGVALNGYRDLAFSPDGATVVSLTSTLTLGGEAHAWRAATGEKIWERDLVTPPEKDFFSKEPRPKIFNPSTATFASDAASIVLTGTVVPAMSAGLVLDAKTGAVLRRTDAPAKTVASPDRRLAASAHYNSPLWHVAIRGKPGAEPLSLKGTPRQVADMAFNPGASRIAVATNDEHAEERGEVKLFETATGYVMLHLGGFSSTIRQVSFTANGHRLLVLTRDGSVRIYDGTPEAPSAKP